MCGEGRGDVGKNGQLVAAGANLPFSHYPVEECINKEIGTVFKLNFNISVDFVPELVLTL